ncbi:hypothetical protein N7535_008417 [Penicillium sp. DV-2018c]|nr:hypothetical protein N7535_008417 [Penicillium sp. DV-2018c]
MAVYTRRCASRLGLKDFLQAELLRGTTLQSGFLTEIRVNLNSTVAQALTADLGEISQVIVELIEGKRIADAATPALLHSDSHKRNIYVSAKDPTVITGLIDWKSTSIKPAFIYADETPDSAAPPRVPVEGLLENEQNERELSKEQERD